MANKFLPVQSAQSILQLFTKTWFSISESNGPMHGKCWAIFIFQIKKQIFASFRVKNWAF